MLGGPTLGRGYSPHADRDAILIVPAKACCMHYIGTKKNRVLGTTTNTNASSQNLDPACDYILGTSSNHSLAEIVLFTIYVSYTENTCCNVCKLAKLQSNIARPSQTL